MAQGFQNENMSIEYVNFDTIITGLKILPERVKNRILRELQASADRILKKAKDEAPEDSGDLVNSGHVSPVVEGDLIAFDVTFGDGSSTPTIYTYPGGIEADGYAWFQEEGTEYIGAQYYLGGPFVDESGKLEDRIGKILDQAGGLSNE